MRCSKVVWDWECSLQKDVHFVLPVWYYLILKSVKECKECIPLRCNAKTVMPLFMVALTTLVTLLADCEFSSGFFLIYSYLLQFCFFAHDTVTGFTKFPFTFPLTVNPALIYQLDLDSVKLNQLAKYPCQKSFHWMYTYTLTHRWVIYLTWAHSDWLWCIVDTVWYKNYTFGWLHFLAQPVAETFGLA